MGQKMKLSVIILEGGKFDKDIYKECLESVSFADEIIKVETDKVRGLFSDYRNTGARQARSEWILYVDTDEIVTPELKNKIEEIVNDNSDAFAYAIPRRNIVFGREMKHCGLWPDYVVRLFKKDKLVKWVGNLHEQPQILSEIKHLKEPFIHKKHDKLSEMVDKTNKWSEVEAKLMFDAHHPPMNFFRFLSAGLREFWLRMIVQTAFMDGVEGTVYGIYQVFSRLISYSKLWEMQLKEK
jgi:(heptosyl)LPS beta-1,4-glucosyltransferase